MKLLNVKPLSKKYDKILTGIDYLRMSIPYTLEGEKKVKKLIEIRNSINTTNSNFRVIYFKEHKVSFMRSSNQGNDTLTATLSYKGISIPILYFCKYMEGRQKTFNSYGKIEVMGSFFRLQELGHIKHNHELMEWIRELFIGQKITRVDYKIDLFSKKEKKIPNIQKVVEIGKKDEWQPFMKGLEGSTGWSIGQRKYKRKVVRCYDKLIDTTKKGKFVLYEDYFGYESVHRIEYELLNKELVNCKWENVNDYIAYLLNEIGLKKQEQVNIKDLELIFKGQARIEEIKDRWDYYKKTKSMVVKCIHAGINPFAMIEECFGIGEIESEKILKLYEDYEKYGGLGHLDFNL